MALGVGLSAAAVGQGVAEQNRQNAPAKEQSPAAAINALVPQLTALVAGLNGLKSKLGVA